MLLQISIFLAWLDILMFVEIVKMQDLPSFTCSLLSLISLNLFRAIFLSAIDLD